MWKELQSAVGMCAQFDDNKTGADGPERQTVFRAERNDSSLSGKLAKEGSSAERGRCYRCGSDEHRADSCRHKATICHKCGKSGHLARVCRQKSGSSVRRQRATPGVKQVDCPSTTTVVPSFEDMDGSLHFTQASCHRTPSEGNTCHTEPLTVEVSINGTPVSMEIDTCSSLHHVK